jgi:hypothetical protein
MGMQRFRCLLTTSVAMAVVAVAAPAVAQTTHTDGPFVHAASGMVLPPSVGEFKRFRESLDGTIGASAGYGYASRQGRIAATFVVFLPPDKPDFCKAYIDAGLESLRKTHPEAQTLPSPEAPPMDGYPAIIGVAERYRYANNPGGALLHSDHYYYCGVGGKWLVEYVFGYAANFDASRQIASFLHDLKVTIPPNP